MIDGGAATTHRTFYCKTCFYTIEVITTQEEESNG